MANTYSQIYIQAVFAVHARDSMIKTEWKEELFKYIGGIFRNQKQKLIAIGGIEDHIHLLFGLKPNVAISDLLRDVKANSSAFINESRFTRRKFHWQEGFGAFSYSRSHLDAVAQYVLNQEKHHKRRHFVKSTSDCWIALKLNTKIATCSTGLNRCRSYGAT